MIFYVNFGTWKKAQKKCKIYSRVCKWPSVGSPLSKPLTYRQLYLGGRTEHILKMSLLYDMCVFVYVSKGWKISGALHFYGNP